MNSKDKARYKEEMNAVYKYLRANQKEHQEAGTEFYFMYHTEDGIAALGSGSRTDYALMLFTHAAAAYYDLYKESGWTLDEYFDELKRNVTEILNLMDVIRQPAGDEDNEKV